MPLFAPADDDIRQGFVRVVNLSDRAGTVSLRARDDAGVLRRTSFRVAASAVYYFNSDDLEDGNTAKSIAGIGDGTGDWHLVLDSDLPIAVTAYLRTDDGFLAAMNATVDRGLDGVHRVMTFNPASNADQESMLRLVNQSERAVTATVRGVDDRGVRGDRPVTVALPPNGASTLTAGELEDMGLGDGAGKWRLLVTAPEPIAVMSLMSTKTGYLTNLSSAPEAPVVLQALSQGTAVSLFTAATEFRQSFVRIINRSPEAGTVTVQAWDDSGAQYGTEESTYGQAAFTIPIDGNQVRHFNSDDLEHGNAAKGIAGVGSGAGHWRLTFSSDLDIQVLAYMRTRDGFLTALHDVVGYPQLTHQVPMLNPGSNTDQESVLRIVGDAAYFYPTSITISGYDDANGAEGHVRVTLQGNEALMLTARQLEDMGLGDGTGKWRLLVTATNPIALMSLMSTRTGHLTNLSYLPDTTHVIAAPLIAKFTYEEDDGIPFGIRFDATASVGDVVDYAWDFGDPSILNEAATGTGPSPLFVYDSEWFFFGRSPHFKYEGIYPATATYPVTLTVTGRHGATATHTKRIVVSNTLSFAGMRDLIGRVADGGGHRGKLIVSGKLPGEDFEGSWVQEFGYVGMKEEGVPKDRIVAHDPETSDWPRHDACEILNQPSNAALVAETLVVNLAYMPAVYWQDDQCIAEHNAVFVAPAGNVYLPTVNYCDPEGMPDRDIWNPNHSFHEPGCTRRRREGFSGIDTYENMYENHMAALATGKLLFATLADRRHDGTVVPYPRAMMCGDTMAYCFAVPKNDWSLTNVAAAKLSAAAYHLFQFYDDADDVVQALQSCTEDIGEPGVDREFGQGLVDLRCAEAMLPVVER